MWWIFVGSLVSSLVEMEVVDSTGESQRLLVVEWMALQNRVASGSESEWTALRKRVNSGSKGEWTTL